MNVDRFVVFARRGKEPWFFHAFAGDLPTAKNAADIAVRVDGVDRAVVMEISGVDAMPMFTWKYGAKK